MSTIHVVLLGVYPGLVDLLSRELSTSTPKVEIHEVTTLGFASEICEAYRDHLVLLLVDPHNLHQSFSTLELWLALVHKEGRAKAYILGRSEEWSSLDHASLCQGIVRHTDSLFLIKQFAAVTKATTTMEDTHAEKAERPPR